MSNIDFISFLLAFLIFYFAIKMLSKMHQEDIFKDRLQDLMKYREKLTEEPSIQKRIYRGPEEEFSLLQKIINKLQKRSSEEQENLNMLFGKAGLRSEHTYAFYKTAKVLMIFPPAIITGVILAYFSTLDSLYIILAMISAALVGSYSVDFGLDFLVRRRQERLRKAFPVAIDLMVICTEAGLSLVASIERVAREISQLSPDLGYELALLSIELSMLSDRRKAFQHFSDRLDAPYFKAVVSNILQAEEYGTPIAQTMRVLSEQFRQDRLVEAEERAAKLPILLSLPMMLFIFPCIYIVIMGPAIITILPMLK